MATWTAHVRTTLVTVLQRDRTNIRTLAAHLSIDEADAAWLYRRSRRVGYPTARAEFDRRCLDPVSRAAD